MAEDQPTQTILRRACRNTGFAQIGNDMLADARLSWEARGVLAFILTQKDDWRVSSKWLLTAAGKLGKDRAQRIIKELMQFGYCRRREMRQAGHFLGMEYVFTDVPDGSDFEPKNTVTSLPQPEKPGPGNPDPENPAAKQYYKEDNNTNPLKPPKGGDAISDDLEAQFSEWWFAFPSQRRDGRLDCWAVWFQIVTGQRLPGKRSRRAQKVDGLPRATPAELLAGARRYTAKLEKQRHARSHNPPEACAPLTWLNGGRWLDDAPPSPSAVPAATAPQRKAPAARATDTDPEFIRFERGSSVYSAYIADLRNKGEGWLADITEKRPFIQFEKGKLPEIAMLDS